MNHKIHVLCHVYYKHFDHLTSKVHLHQHQIYFPKIKKNKTTKLDTTFITLDHLLAPLHYHAGYIFVTETKQR